MIAKIRRTAAHAAALLLLVSLAGCQRDRGPAAANANANSPAGAPAANSSTRASSTPAAATTPEAASPASAGGSLATPTDAYRTAYAARRNKDTEGLKRVMSKEALEFFTDIGEADGKTLDDMLKQMTNRPQAPAPETRNEKIDGNRATLEYLNDKGTWATMDFVREDGVWKLALPKGP